MKRVLLMGCALACFYTGFSQKAKVREATKHLELAQKSAEIRNNAAAVKEGTAAKEAIDAASADASTSGDYETWYYKAAIYLLLQEQPDFANEPLYRTAGEALLKAISIDKKKTLNKSDIKNLVIRAGYYYYNDGVTEMQRNNYKGAAEAFDKAYAFLNMEEGKLLSDVKEVQQDKAKAIMYGGIASYYAEDYATAAQKLEVASNDPIGAKESNVFLNLANAYGKLKQKDKQFAVIEKGKKNFPSDPNIVAAEINYYIDNNESAKLLTRLEEETAKEPNRDDLHSNLGLTYMQLTESVKDKPEELQYWKKSFESFKKALNLKPNDNNYQYMMGLSGFNYAASLNNAMNATKDNREYAIMKKDRDEAFHAVIPQFEKLVSLYKAKETAKLTASELQKYETVLRALSNIYTNLEMNDKYAEVKALLKGIQE